MSILDKIVEHKKKEIPLLKNKYSHVELIPNANNRSLSTEVRNSPYINIIAEIKRGSPSKGAFALDLDIKKQAQFYQNNNASCISVLVDEKFFYGSYDFLSTIRSVTTIPILCKEFIIDPFQIKLAASLGADVILLIERILTLEELEKFIQLARLFNLEVLIEVDSLNAFNKIKHLNFKLCGINNRDLSDFAIDLNKTAQIADSVKCANKFLITESGIHSREDLKFLKNYNIDAALIGEALVKKKNLLRELILLKNIQIKICGITDPLTARYLDGKVEYIGLVFAKSKRQLSIKEAQRLRKEIVNSKVVGVFKDQSASFIEEIYKACDLDLIQVHNDIHLDLPEEIVIKAMDYKNSYNTYDGYILLDNKLPGSGEAYPLCEIKRTHNQRYILAGGLSPDNVTERIKEFPCHIVDVSSGVEENGQKSLDLIDTFIEKVRNI